MFGIKMSSLWFWGLVISCEILLISLVGYTLISYQSYNTIASQLQFDAKQIQSGNTQPESNYLVINNKGQIEYSSTEFRHSIPSSLVKPSSIPDRSVVYDDLYAYRLQNLSQSNNYLITYQPYKKTNPWPARIIIASGLLIILAIVLISLYHVLNNTVEGRFVIS